MYNKYYNLHVYDVYTSLLNIVFVLQLHMTMTMTMKWFY